MATIDELVIKLTAESAELRAQLGQASKVTEKAAKDMESAIAGFSKKSEQSTSKLSGVFQVFAGTILANVVTSAVSAVASAFGSMIGQLNNGIDSALKQEAAMTKLANSMALSGNFTQDTTRAMSSFADEMESATGISDDLVLSNLSLLSSITRLDKDGLQEAQKAAIDLSAALGIDVNAATNLVAKGIEGNTTAFKRYGIEIQAGKDKTENFANVVGALSQRFGGAAQAQMQSFGGSIKAITNNFGNFFEALAEVITKNRVVLVIFQEVSKALKEMTGFVTDSGSQWRDMFGRSIISVGQALGGLLVVFNEVVRIFVAGFKSIWLAGQALINTFEAAIALLSGKGLSEAAGKFKETGAAFDSLVETTTGAGVAGSAIESLAQIINSASDAYNEYGATVDEVGPSLKNQKDQVAELTAAEKARMDQLKAFGEELLKQSMDINNGYAMQQEALQIAFDNELISFEAFKDAKLISQQDQFAQEQLMLQEALNNKLLSEDEYQAARTQLEQEQGLERLKLQGALAKQEEALNKQKLSDLNSTLGTIASLQSSSSKELFAVGKAAAIAQATIDGVAAVQKAWSQGGAFGAVLAAGVAAATAANISKISSTGLNRGIDSVPGTGNRDNFPAMLTPGERVVPAETNKDLTDFLRGGGQSQGMTFVFNVTAPWISEREFGPWVIEQINDAMANGTGQRMVS